MKKITVVLLLVIMTFSLFACGEKESPAAYLPSLRYDNVPLEMLTLLVNRTNGDYSVGGNETAAQLVKQYVSSVPYTEISDGRIEIKNGSDKNVAYNTRFSGVFDENGDLTEYEENDLSKLPAGKYIICLQVAERRTEYSSVYLYIAGIEKK